MIHCPRKKAMASGAGTIGRAYRCRNGFTLIEVLLALALSAILLGALALAIQVQLRATSTGRVDVAQAQLARALLKRIGDDVREAVWYEPFESQSMVAPPQSASLVGQGRRSSGQGGQGSTGGLAGVGAPGGQFGGGQSGGGQFGGGSGASFGGGAGGAPGGAGGTSSAGTTGTTRSTTTTSNTTTTSTTTTTSRAGTTGGAGGTGGGPSGGGLLGGGGGGASGAPSGSGGAGGGSGGAGGPSAQQQPPTLYPLPVQPGLRGGSNWLQMDVSRLPRVDQMVAAQGLTTGYSSDRASDVKTVSYYMAGATGLPAELSSPTSMLGETQQGLLRRQADRATMLGTGVGGAAVGTLADPEPLAPEVVALAFRFYDGQTWFNSWDSQQQNGLPKAVEISAQFLVGQLDPPADQAPVLVDTRPTVSYRLLVSPAAWRPAKPAPASVTSTGGVSTSSATTTGGVQ